jgi:hypothetical protein
MPAQYGISDILRLSGTDFDDSKASGRHPTHCLSITRPHRQAVVGDSEEEPRNVGLLPKEGSPSYGDWMKVNILVIDNEESIK